MEVWASAQKPMSDWSTEPSAAVEGQEKKRGGGSCGRDWKWDRHHGKKKGVLEGGGDLKSVRHGGFPEKKEELTQNQTPQGSEGGEGEGNSPTNNQQSVRDTKREKLKSSAGPASRGERKRLSEVREKSICKKTKKLRTRRNRAEGSLSTSLRNRTKFFGNMKEDKDLVLDIKERGTRH